MALPKHIINDERAKNKRMSKGIVSKIKMRFCGFKHAKEGFNLQHSKLSPLTYTNILDFILSPSLND